MQTGRHCMKAVRTKASLDELAEALYKDIEEIIVKYKSNQEDNKKASDKLFNEKEETNLSHKNEDTEVREIYDLLNLEQ